MTGENFKSRKNAKVCYLCNQNLQNDGDINYQKLKRYNLRTRKSKSEAHSMYNFRYLVPREIPVIKHNL